MEYEQKAINPQHASHRSFVLTHIDESVILAWSRLTLDLNSRPFVSQTFVDPLVANQSSKDTA